jgi:CRISPR-associated protein Cas2
MTARDLYLVAYDIRCPRRLRRARQVVKGLATGGQKSVFECYLTDGERRQLLRDLESVVDRRHDQLLLLRLAHGARVATLGVAEAPPSPDEAFFLVE